LILLNASEKVGLEINRKMKVYVHDLSSECRKNHNRKINNKFSENVAKFKHLEITGTKKNLKINKYKIIILPAYCIGMKHGLSH
jgi:hypothetical protein